MRFERDAELLPLADAAAMVGISARTLALWTRRGLIRSVVTRDGRRLISRDDLARCVVTPDRTETPDD